jgi:hypothetical protein
MEIIKLRAGEQKDLAGVLLINKTGKAIFVEVEKRSETKSIVSILGTLKAEV